MNVKIKVTSVVAQKLRIKYINVNKTKVNISTATKITTAN